MSTEQHTTVLEIIQGDLLNVQSLAIDLSNDIDELKQTVKEQGDSIGIIKMELKKLNEFKAAWLKDALAKIEKSNRRNKASARRIAALEARFITAGEPFVSTYNEDSSDDSDNE